MRQRDKVKWPSLLFSRFHQVKNCTNFFAASSDAFPSILWPLRFRHCSPFLLRVQNHMRGRLHRQGEQLSCSNYQLLFRQASFFHINVFLHVDFWTGSTRFGLFFCLFVCQNWNHLRIRERRERERDSVEKETESGRERGWMALYLQPGSD